MQLGFSTAVVRIRPWQPPNLLCGLHEEMPIESLSPAEPNRIPEELKASTWQIKDNMAADRRIRQSIN